MKVKAYSYVRFSDPTQAEGYSYERQMEAAREYVAEHNLELDTELDLADLGVSAFQGANIAEGSALGAFISAVEKGKINRGSYLLVENLDRLSREEVPIALELFLKLINSGIVIVTLMDEMKYQRKGLDERQLLGSIFIMSRAHDESKTKSKRSKKNWDKRRKNIDVEKYTKWSPKWVYLSDDRKEFIVHQERAKVVQKIFKWAEGGLGTALTIQKLEDQNIEPWDMGQEGMNVKRVAKKWYGSYIHKILHNRAVLGEYELKIPGGPKATQIIKNYYPQVISEDLFYAAQHARRDRNINKGGRGAGRKGKYFSNLFSGFAFCGYSVDTYGVAYRCEGNFEKMVFANKGGKYRYLQCGHIKNGTSKCANCRKMYRYDKFEKSFLSFINDIDVSLIAGFADELSDEIRELTGFKGILLGRKKFLNEQIQKYLKSFTEMEKIPNAMTDQLNSWEEEKERISNELIETQHQLSEKTDEYNKTKISKESMTSLVHSMSVKTGKELFELRAQLSNAIKKVIHSVLIFPSGPNTPYGSADYRKVTYEINEDGESIEYHNHKDELSDGVSELMGSAIKRSIDEGINTELDTDPFFIVIYKNGKQVAYCPDSKDPEKLILMSSNDEHGVLT